MPQAGPLSIFELPAGLTVPALEACRGFNTSLDKLFYDTPALTAALRQRGVTVDAEAMENTPSAATRLDLGAWRDPEGSLLVIDPGVAPYVTPFGDVRSFQAWERGTGKIIETASITGVGSSALGSAALAWDISAALGEPVLAIVPGYGVADAVLQALGGWYGFGLFEALDAKSHLQALLAAMAPKTAAIGRRLSATSPGARPAPTGAPVFRYGCGSSDVLHDLMAARPFKRLVGHSKGALAIGNALADLAADRTAGLRIITLGCPITKTLEAAEYHQFLGLFDALGALNAWGNRPDAWEPTDHSTNLSLPLSMRVGELVVQSGR